MIQDYQKFQIPDENKEGKNIIGEVNWNKDDPKTNGCKMIRLTMSNGDVAIVDRRSLNQILFAIGDPSDQRKLLPQKLETVHQRPIQLGIKATKNIKKGEMINLPPIKVSVPCTYIREIIGEKAWNKEIQRVQKGGLWINPTV